MIIACDQATHKYGMIFIQNRSAVLAFRLSRTRVIKKI